MRARLLERAAELYEQHLPQLAAMAVREAGKSLANGVGEVREAVDYLRYYAAQIPLRVRPGFAFAAGPRGVHQSVEFPTVDLHRPDRRRARRRQFRACQAS